MSTYIVAYANGPFAYLESSYTSPLSGKVRPLRIYSMFIALSVATPLIFCLATPDVIHQAKFALDVKEKVLPLYEQVFDIEYPLPKLDTLVVSVFFLSPRSIPCSLCFPRLLTSTPALWRTGV